MEAFFGIARIVQLKSEHNTYLVADNGETLSQSKSPSKNSRWQVLFMVDKPEVTRLRSCSSGKYLGVSFAHGVTEKRVGLFSTDRGPNFSAEWVISKASGYSCIRLSNPVGTFLRANSSVYHGDESITLLEASQFHADGVIWDVDVLRSGVRYGFEASNTRLTSGFEKLLSYNPFYKKKSTSFSPVMKIFVTRAKVVQLKNMCSTYLVADEDGETIRTSSCSSTNNSRWYVEFVYTKPEVIRLKNCETGKYLGVSNHPFLLSWMIKKKVDVVQCCYSPSLNSLVEWLPNSDWAHGRFWVRLRSHVGAYLQAKTNPITLVVGPSPSFGQWDEWEVNTLEFDEESINDPVEMQKSSGSSCLINQEPSKSKDKIPFPVVGDEGKSYSSTRLSHAGPLNRNRWMDEATQEKMKLHCCLFPREYAFERETLVQLWMAAGYLTEERMEESGRRYFEILLNKGHILSSGIDTFSGECKYTINFDKAFSVPLKDEDIYTIWNEESTETEGTKSWHVSLVSDAINPTTFEALKRFNELRTLLFVRNYGSSLEQLPSELFLALPCLEALDLSGTHMSELPSSIGNLRQLRYLNLSFTLIESLPETIGRLQVLQTLKLEGCKQLYDLPKGFVKLVNLRHLYFDILGQLSRMPRGIGALVELRTLSAFIVDILDGCNIRELRSMNNLNGSCCISGLEHVTVGDAEEAALFEKVNLTRLQLNWNGYGPNDKAVEHLKPQLCLEELEIIGYPGSKFPEWICDEEFTQLNCITFRKCEVSKLEFRLGRLRNLKCLEIIQMDRVETIIFLGLSSVGPVNFPKLEKLTIDGMFSLVRWSALTQTGDFPLLSEITLKNCPKLNFFRFIPYLGSLKRLEISNCRKLESLSNEKLPDNLETLMFDDCPLLNERYAKDGDYWDKIKHVPHIWFDLEDMHSPSLDGADSDMEDYADPEMDIVSVHDSILFSADSSIMDEDHIDSC